MKVDNGLSAYDLSPEQAASLTPRIFGHQELLMMTGDEKKIPRSRLVNKLNQLNFIDGSLSMIFFHPQHLRESLLLEARPEPCIGNDFTCHLVFNDPAPELTGYQPRFLMIDDGLGVMLAPVRLLGLNRHILTASLPEEGLMKTRRLTRRHRCRGIACEIISNGATYDGTLIDFTANAFSVQLSESGSETDFNHSGVARINLLQGGVKLYSGACRPLRNGSHMPDGRFVYAPVHEEIRVFPQRKTRNPRRQIAPSFTISFQHPFFRKRIERDIFDVSTSGFSIQDTPQEQMLMAGMVIPELTIHYAGIIEMKCSAQVVYHREDRENNLVQSGLAITDMDVRSYSRLNHLVGAHLDAHARVSTTVDMSALWEFFFDTSFIYGEKYQHLHPHRNSFKETYRKLYQDDPEIARHFTYEKNGKIYGHIAMVHAYEPSWVIHHFSAKPMESKIPGLLILRQIAHYLNGCYRFRSYGIHYVMTYYRPDNKVVSKIFGGFARELGNAKGSSLDLFSYLYVHTSARTNPLPADWTIRQCTADDFSALKQFYEKSSGGLLLDAFGLDAPMDALKESFRNAGFQRDCRTCCLCFDGKPKAFFIVNRSDRCLNLSDLLNGIKIFVTDDRPLEWSTLLSAISVLGSDYHEDQIPVLIYPVDYLAAQGIKTDKNYELWILKTDPFLEQYTDYMARKFRTKYRTTDGKNTPV
ncbi:MAG: hypothetical protein K4571_11940 [Deltaproteobacteria bacterium]